MIDEEFSEPDLISFWRGKYFGNIIAIDWMLSNSLPLSYRKVKAMTLNLTLRCRPAQGEWRKLSKGNNSRWYLSWTLRRFSNFPSSPVLYVLNIAMNIYYVSAGIVQYLQTLVLWIDILTIVLHNKGNCGYQFSLTWLRYSKLKDRRTMTNLSPSLFGQF